MFDFKFNFKIDNLFEIIFSLNLIRECALLYLNNYEQQSQLNKFIRFIDNKIRHYRQPKFNFAELKSEINEQFEKLNIIPLFNHIFKFINLINDKKILQMPITKLIEESNIDFDFNKKNISLKDYILYKTKFGLKIRHMLEKEIIFNSNDNEMIKKWMEIDSEKKPIDFENEFKIHNKYNKLKINSFDENFLAHINSLQFAKIIEMPIKKIKKCYLNINEIIKEKQ